MATRATTSMPPAASGSTLLNGEIKWHFQTTPREGWDYDGVNEVVAYERPRRRDKRFATADRNGFFYVLNREDGAFVRGVHRSSRTSPGPTGWTRTVVRSG